MKRTAPLLAAALSLGALTASAQLPTYDEVAPDLGLSLELALPGIGDFDLYESGLGVNLQFRDLFSAPWGYAFSIGYGSWSADSGARDPGANLFDFDGDMEVIPFGASVLYQLHTSDTLNVVLDGGLRYYVNDADITARNRDEGGNRRFALDIDDNVVVRVAVGGDYALTPDLTWSFGVGVQIDVTEGDITTSLGPAEDNRMEALFFETGLRMPL
jgi:hypothetical protein